MAKQTTKTKAPAPKNRPTPRSEPQRQRAVAARDTKAVASGSLADMMAADAGAGLSSDPSDNLVPLVYILQPLSPQVLKRNEAFIDGAEPGMIWLRNAAEELHHEIDFQPCYSYKEWVEWVPRKSGGGFAGRHKDRPSEAQTYRDPERPNSTRWKMPNGNDLVETRYYVGRIWLDSGARLPYIMPFSSTGHTVAKALMTQMNSRLTAGGTIAPAFANLVRFNTELKKNNAGEWYLPRIENIRFLEEDEVEEYLAGKQLQEQFMRGDLAAAEAYQPGGADAPFDENGDM